MKSAFILALVASRFVIPFGKAKAESSKKIQRSSAKVKPETASGDVEAIKPKDPPSKDTRSAASWKGSYVCVNAGMGFGAAAGTSVMVPIGTGGKTEE